jgi:hypothetical protein
MAVGVVLAVLLAVFAAPVLAQSDEIPAFATWLEWASGPLIPAIVAFVLSFVVEYFPQYEALAPKVKRLVFLGLCMIVPLLAATARGALGYEPWSFDPLYWHALWAGFAAYGVGNVTHTRRLPDA